MPLPTESNRIVHLSRTATDRRRFQKRANEIEMDEMTEVIDRLRSANAVSNLASPIPDFYVSRTKSHCTTYILENSQLVAGVVFVAL